VADQTDNGIEIDEDLAFQEREWRFERIGWIAMFLVIILALAGLFGTGPLSASSAGNDGLTVDYQRFVRHQGQTEITVTIDARHAVDGQVELTITGEYHDSLAIESVSPEPVEVRGDGNDVVYVFALAEGAGSIDVSFGATPRQIGPLPGEVAAGDATVTFFQFAYP